MICDHCWQNTFIAYEKKTGKPITLYSRLEQGGKFDVKAQASGKLVATYKPNLKEGFKPHDLICQAQQNILNNLTTTTATTTGDN